MTLPPVILTTEMKTALAKRRVESLAIEGIHVTQQDMEAAIETAHQRMNTPTEQAVARHCARITKPMTLDEILRELDGGDYSAEMLLQHLLIAFSDIERERDALREALEEAAEALAVALERLGVAMDGDHKDRKADEDSWGGTATLMAARAALAKSKGGDDACPA